MEPAEAVKKANTPVQWYQSEDNVKEIVNCIFNVINKEIKFKDGALERTIERTNNYAMAFGWAGNENLIREYLIKAIEQEAKDANNSVRPGE